MLHPSSASAPPPAGAHPRVRYPRQLVYDHYCAEVSPQIWTEESLRRAGLTRTAAHVRAVTEDLRAVLRASRVYVLDAGATQEIARAHAKEMRCATIYANTPPSLPFPAPPHLPVWIEVEEDAFQPFGKQGPLLKAFLLTRTPGGILRALVVGADPRTVMATDYAAVFGTLTMKPTTILNVFPAGTWGFQAGQCLAPCPVAAQRLPFHPDDQLPGIDQVQHAALAAQAFCPCYRLAHSLYLLLRLLLWMLDAEGIGVTIVERQAAVRDDLPLKRAHAHEAKAAAEAWNRTHAVHYVQVSLSSRTIVRYLRDAAGHRRRVIKHLSEDAPRALIGLHRRSSIRVPPSPGPVPRSSGSSPIRGVCGHPHHGSRPAFS